MDELIQLREYPINNVLKNLLIDKTTKGNIVFATNSYSHRGPLYLPQEHINEESILGLDACEIQPRISKSHEQQKERTKAKAEVFTSSWTCNKMNNICDEIWFGRSHVFNHENEDNTWTYTEDPIVFPKEKSWQDYVDSKRLEITCGEAPFIISRYDSSTGHIILPLKKRIGILDRKLRIVTENTTSEEEWIKWVTRAFQSVYGYEWQGDSLLIARINLVQSFVEYMQNHWNRNPTDSELKKISNIITWNTWQMDGLTGTIPYSAQEKIVRQFSVFDDLDKIPRENKSSIQAAIFDWRSKKSIVFNSIKEMPEMKKFFAALGNPPYQDETTGDNKAFAPPVYHKFMDSAFEVAEKTILIHPARFLFKAGSTPKEWNKKILNDPHFKILFYEDNASKLFANTIIKGGVAISYRDHNKNFGPIIVYSPYIELNTIIQKASPAFENESLMRIIFVQNRFNLDELYKFSPESVIGIGSKGKDKRFETNIFDKVPAFSEERKSPDDIAVIGVSKNKREWRFLPKRCNDLNHENLFYWKVLIVRVNGTGAFGETLSTPMIAKPGEAYTKTFIGIGAFSSKEEAENALKYVKTKFMRTMLGVLKVTQQNNRDTWRMVPIQDFSSSSDINWNNSIKEIDEQLYNKYKLSQEEIKFINTHVKEMD